MLGLHAMIQLHGLAVRGDEIVPAARAMQRVRKSKNLVSDGIAMVMIVKEPGIESALAKSVLNRSNIHPGIVSNRWNGDGQEAV